MLDAGGLLTREGRVAARREATAENGLEQNARCRRFVSNSLPPAPVPFPCAGSTLPISEYGRLDHA
jgi:hypothetical protein